MKVKNICSRPITIRGVRIEPDQIASVEDLKGIDVSMIRRIEVVKEAKREAGQKSGKIKKEEKVINDGNTMV